MPSVKPLSYSFHICVEPRSAYDRRTPSPLCISTLHSPRSKEGRHLQFDLHTGCEAGLGGATVFGMDHWVQKRLVRKKLYYSTIQYNLV